MLKDFSTWFKTYAAQALTHNERRLILLEGSHQWAKALLSSLPVEDKIWLTYSDSAIIMSNVGQKQFRQKLGGESHYLTFVCPEITEKSEAQFNADAFAALSGTLVAGGILFLIMPEKSEETKKSIFLQRLKGLIPHYKAHCVIKETEPTNLPCCHDEDHPLDTEKQSVEFDNLSYLCKSTDQLIAVKAILKVVSGHRKRPLVLTADRGRGKSSALAIACAELLKNASLSAQANPIEIVISSGHINALNVFFKQLSLCLKQGEEFKNSFVYFGSRVRFLAVDELVSLSANANLKANLVIIDEAASVPVHLLKKLLEHNHRMVFSSTVHGYEGAGRGFAIKFKQVLDAVCPNWKSLEMRQPMRWRVNDPLEEFIFESCLLNAKINTFDANEISETFFKKVPKQELLRNEKLLAEIYAILVTAHYQTKPNDLKLLLDNEQLDCFCLFSSTDRNNKVIGVALMMREGTVNADDNDNDNGNQNYQYVSGNKGRLKNQFLPQSLLVQHGIEQAFQLSYFRIMRIAIHPQIQNKGFGGELMKNLIHYAQLQRADFIGSSFGANARLLAFWLNNNFQLTRIGFKREQSSGEHSALVLQPLSDSASSLLLTPVKQFYQQFEYLLVDEYQHLTVDLVVTILQSFPKQFTTKVSQELLKDVTDFTTGARQFSPCVYSLHQWLKSELVTGSLKRVMKKTLIDSTMDLNPQEDNLPLKQVVNIAGLLIQRVMQKQSVGELCEQYHLSGRKAFDSSLKTQVSKILLLK
ncbi:MAG: GNAT family N-acetyltransferase [Colwellia sp.]